MREQALRFLEIDHPNRRSRKSEYPGTGLFLGGLWNDKKAGMRVRRIEKEMIQKSNWEERVVQTKG